MPKEQKSRVRGAEKIKVRPWPYAIDQFTWIDRLNYIRREKGEAWTSRLLGYTDQSFKSLRRLASGDRRPNRERYEKINETYNRLRRQRALIDISREIEDLIKEVNNEIDPRSREKIEFFLNHAEKYHYRRPEPFGLPASPSAAEKMSPPYWYHRTVNIKNQKHPSAEVALGLALLYIVEKNQPDKLKASLIMFPGHPSEELFRKRVDTWIEDISEPTDYLAVTVRILYYTYYSVKR